MLLRDFLKLSAGAVGANRLRSFLTSLGIAIGIAAVILLTSIGEGVHNFVLAEFTQFGLALGAQAGDQGALVHRWRIQRLGHLKFAHGQFHFSVVFQSFDQDQIRLSMPPRYAAVFGLSQRVLHRIEIRVGDRARSA